MLEMGFQRHVESILASIRYPGSKAARAAVRSSLTDQDAQGALRLDTAGLTQRAKPAQMLLFSATLVSRRERAAAGASLVAELTLLKRRTLSESHLLRSNATFSTLQH